MKIICDSCGAKYSIADEKVQGKVFKIRCKKCSEVIVVEGTNQAGAQSGGDDYSAAYETGGAAEWYVVLDGERVGPITPEEVEAYFTAGQLHSESYVWKDGLDDWVMLETLSEFAHIVQDAAGPDEKTMIADQSGQAVSGAEAHMGEGFGAQAGYGDQGGYAAEGAQGGGYDYGGNDYGAGDDATAVMDPDQFRNESFGGAQSSQDAQIQTGEEVKRESGAFAAVESGSYDQQSGSGGYGAEVAESYDSGGYDDGYEADEGGMFAAFDSDSDDGGYGDGGGFGGYDEPDDSPDLSGGAGNDLVGARNENSVLFSLSSVDQVQAVNKQSGAGQAKGNDKSGLIDIQALASTHAAMKDGGGASGGDEDEFVAGTMSMPALMPSGSHKSNNGLIIGVSIAAAVLVLGLGGVIAFLVLSDDDEPQEQTVIVQQEAADDDEEDDTAAQEAEAAAAAAAAEAEEEEADDEDEEVAEEEDEAEEEEAVARADSGSSTRRSQPRSQPRQQRSQPRQQERQPSPSPPSSSDSGSGSGGGILDQIDRQEDRQADARSDLPEDWSRSMIQGTIRRYTAQVNNCSSNSNPDGLSGNATIRFVVSGSGNVSSASAQGEFSGTEVGSCLEGVVRSMRFPETQRDSRTISYPFVVR